MFSKHQTPLGYREATDSGAFGIYTLHFAAGHPHKTSPTPVHRSKRWLIPGKALATGQATPPPHARQPSLPGPASKRASGRTLLRPAGAAMAA